MISTKSLAALSIFFLYNGKRKKKGEEINMKMKDVKSLISGGAILIGIVLYMIFADPPPDKDALPDHITIEQVEQATGKERIEVDFVQAYDGDTAQVKVDGKKEKVRFLMVDTPEMNYQKGDPMPLAEDGKYFTKKLLMEARHVYVVFDEGKETDHYDRWLAYIFADDKLVQEELLKEGLAAVRFVNPGNNTFESEFKEIEQTAKDANKGVWKYDNYLQRDGFHPEVVQ